ncbi:MAG: hypothetical protein NTU94_02540 [Planctomycetota bacterium]|nr:hypothetical protein [Planctomycetota bacterium]
MLPYDRSPEAGPEVPRSFATAHGGLVPAVGQSGSLLWREPPDVKGPFAATPVFAGPFKIEAKPFEIQVPVEVTEH